MNPKATYITYDKTTYELVEIVRNSQKALVYREKAADSVPLAFRRTIKVLLPKSSKNGVSRVTLEVTTPIYGPNKDNVMALKGSSKTICTHFFASGTTVAERDAHLRFFMSANWVTKDDNVETSDTSPVGEFAPVLTGKASIVV